MVKQEKRMGKWTKVLLAVFGTIIVLAYCGTTYCK